tara:strand:+ start:390 stop:818 length:429 start_codon:yes stop_codon:yes gene_type:complete
MQYDLFYEVQKNKEEEDHLRICVGCGSKKNLKHFRVLVRRLGDRNTLSSTCSDCDDRASIIKSIWKKNNPLPKNYACPICGMTHKDYLNMGKYRTQSPFSIDHCQKNMEVRGWICNPCNSAMGLAKHDINILRKMVRYLTDG